MTTVLLIVHMMIAAAMIGVVLLQRSEGGALGIGGGGGGFMTGRGAANFLTRVTAGLAGAFFVTSLALSIWAGMDRKPRSVLQDGPPATTEPGPPGAPPAPPTGPAKGPSVFDQLKESERPPAGPTVPQSK